MKGVQNAQGTSSSASMATQYTVPSLDGRMIPATPLKFYLKYRPPTIAVLYTMQRSTQSKKKNKKYIHEIFVDFSYGAHKYALPSEVNLEKLCETLCSREATYLNTNIISKTQVLELLGRLYKQEFGKDPPSRATQSTLPTLDSKEKLPAAAADSKKQEASKKVDEDDYDDTWGDEDAWGDNFGYDKKPADKKEAPAAKKEDPEDEEGLQDGDPHKQMFDTSKDRIARQQDTKKDNKSAKPVESDDEFDLGFSSNKKNTVMPKGKKEHDEDSEEMTEEQQMKQINDQFDKLYSGDAELREVLKNSDVEGLTVEDKYRIIQAYMEGGGAQGLRIDLVDEDEEEDARVVEEMSAEDKALLEERFAEIYEADPQLKQALGDIKDLTLLVKYQIMLQYQKNLEQSGWDDSDIFEHEGKRYKRVQIEGKDEEYLMDEDQNIYDLNLKQIGRAGDSDDEEI